MLASNVHVGMQALVHHAQPLLDAASEFEVLQKAYIEYAGALGYAARDTFCLSSGHCTITAVLTVSLVVEALRDPVSDASKARLGHLMDQMQARGVYGWVPSTRPVSRRQCSNCC